MGRFAPTPSGDLHLGSLYCAAASYLDARSHAGRWLLRMEDLDRPREVAGAADGILRTLQLFGFEWDGVAVRQRDRLALYQAALEELRQRDLLFECSCSRLQLEDDTRYPGTCRTRIASHGIPAARRLKVDPGFIVFADRVQGTFRQDVCASVGDLILQRRDQVIAYLPAVVVDDAAQGITHVVRGADLLDNTPRQIYLQRLLGYASPAYAHVPVLTEPDGAKLAKSRRSVRLDGSSPLDQLLSVFSLLGLGVPPAGPSNLEEAWRWAIDEWNVEKVPKRLNLRVSGS